MEWVSLCKIERDYACVGDSEARCQEGFLGCGTHSDNAIVASEFGEAVVEGWIGDCEGAAAYGCHAFRGFEWER